MKQISKHGKQGKRSCSDGILWNTAYLERSAAALRAKGRMIDDALLKHAAPVHWNHLILTGDCSWRQNKRVKKGGFRPLRQATTFPA